MNNYYLYAIGLLFATVITAGCRQDRTCGLADYAGWERSARQDMRDVIVLSDLSNAEKGEAVQGLADRYSETASQLSDSIAQLLPERSRRLYNRERHAYRSWREWQETVSMQLIGDIWDLWYGGSALGSFQTMHIYRIEDQNLEDNLELYGLLCGMSAKKAVVEDISLFQLREEANRLLNEVMDKDHHDRMAQTISVDLSILRNWISAREAFSMSLPRSVRREYEKQTNRWLLLCRLQYAYKFCHQQ